MAIIKSYPLGTPSLDDYLLGTEGPNSEDNGATKNYTLSDIKDVIGTGSQGAQGPTGPAGAAGSNGLNGAQGAPGADGTSISILGTVANCAALPTTGNTTGDLYILDADDAGCSGTAGDGFVWTEGNVWLNIGPIRGPQGIQGNIGQQGSTGPEGPQGQQGSIGPKGDKGERGEIGATGSTGPAGADGVVQSIVPGTNVTIDDTDPANPIINASGGSGGGLTGSGIPGTLPIWTSSTELGDSFLQKGSFIDSLQTSNATASGTSSIAFGQGAQAISGSSVAIGAYSIADVGIGPIALGYQAQSKNDSTVSIGYNTESTGRRSTAIGAESQAYAVSSTAIGRARVDATADYSVAIGVGAGRPVVSGKNSIIIGEGGEASGLISMIFGNYCTATGQGSKVIAGNNASATGNYAVCSGSNTEAHDAYETVFGLFNKISTGSKTTRPSSPPNNIFVVGNGTAASRSNALELNDDGELTLPSYASTFVKTGLAVEINTGKIITADAPNYTNRDLISCAPGSSQSIDTTFDGILYLTWSGNAGTFNINLPDASLAINYYRKFMFILNSTFGQPTTRDVVLTPFSGQQINGVATYTIPQAEFNVVEIWNAGGQWIIISKIT